MFWGGGKMLKVIVDGGYKTLSCTTRVLSTGGGGEDSSPNTPASPPPPKISANY